MSSLVGRHPTGPAAPGRAPWLDPGRAPGERVDALIAENRLAGDTVTLGSKRRLTTEVTIGAVAC